MCSGHNLLLVSVFLETKRSYICPLTLFSTSVQMPQYLVHTTFLFYFCQLMLVSVTGKQNSKIARVTCQGVPDKHLIRCTVAGGY